jgi:hypothetical protein
MMTAGFSGAAELSTVLPWFETSPGQQFPRTYLEKTQHKNGLVEWLKV